MNDYHYQDLDFVLWVSVLIRFVSVECMRIGVVPIIVGHQCLPLEQFINWEECCLIFDNTEDVSHDTHKAKNGK